MTISVTWDASSSPSPSFVNALQTSLVPSSSIGSSTPTFSRNLASYLTDFEGRLVSVPANAARMAGSRIVQNLITASTEVFSGWFGTGGITTGVADPVGGTSAITLTASGSQERYVDSVTGGLANVVSGMTLRNSIWIRRRAGTGQIQFYDGSNAAGFFDATSTVTSSWQRIAGNLHTVNAAQSRIGIYLATNGDAVDIWHPQVEDTNGKTISAPSEYVSVGVLSAPYQGLGVDGIASFNYFNPNTVSNNIVTDNS